MTYPNKQDYRQSRKKVVKTEIYIQTYRLILTMECGHRRGASLSRKAYLEDKRGPKTQECGECAKELAAKRPESA